jgi:tetratricopeptide (TPR) repeat protein
MLRRVRLGFSKRWYTKVSSTENMFETYPNAITPAENLKKGLRLFMENNFLDARKMLDKAAHELSLIMPEDHPLLAIAYNNLAECIKNAPEPSREYNYNDINVLYLNSINIWMKQGDNEEHFETIATITSNYGVWNLEKGKHAEALPWFQRALSYRRRLSAKSASANNDTQLGLTLNNMGIALTGLGRLTEALEGFVEAQQLLDAHLTRGHPDYLKFLFNYGNCLLEYKRFEESREKFILLFENMEGIAPDKAHIVDLSIIKTSESFITQGNLPEGIEHMKGLLRYKFSEGHQGIIFASTAALMMQNKSNSIEIHEYAKKAAEIGLKNTPGLTGMVVKSLVDGIKSKLK